MPKLEHLGEWTQVCKAEGYAMREDHYKGEVNLDGIHLPLGGDSGADDIILSEGVRVKGRVVDTAGRPLAGMTVLRNRLGMLGESIHLGESNENGDLDAVPLMPGECTFNAPFRTKFGRLGAESMPAVASLSELPLPFVGQTVVVPDREGDLDVVFQALPHRLVQFEWEEEEANDDGRQPIFTVEGRLGKRGGVWRGDLFKCRMSDGSKRLCAQVPVSLTSFFLRVRYRQSGQVYSYHPLKSDSEKLLNVVSLGKIPADGRFGKIVSELSAKLTVKIMGFEKREPKPEHFAAYAKGRFGERPLGRPWKNGKLHLRGIYPGETVEYTIRHPDFEVVKKQELDLKTGEKREREVQLVARKKKDQTSIYRLQTQENSAFWVHSGNKEEIYFVLYHPGFLQSGFSYEEWDDGTWKYNGAATTAKGKAFRVRFSSQKKDRVEIDGKEYDVRRGRIFVLKDDEGVKQHPSAAPTMKKEHLEYIANNVAERERLERNGPPKLKRLKMTEGLLKSLHWGKPIENGLRAAVTFEPRRQVYQSGDIVERWYYLYNSGERPVSFSVGHSQEDHMVNLRLEDKDGLRVKPKSMFRWGATALLPTLLNPGEYVRVPGLHVCLGPKPEKYPKRTYIGTIINQPTGTILKMSGTLQLYKPRNNQEPHGWGGEVSTGQFQFKIEP